RLHGHTIPDRAAAHSPRAGSRDETPARRPDRPGRRHLRALLCQRRHPDDTGRAVPMGRGRGCVLLARCSPARARAPGKRYVNQTSAALPVRPPGMLVLPLTPIAGPSARFAAAATPPGLEASTFSSEPAGIGNAPRLLTVIESPAQRSSAFARIT